MNIIKSLIDSEYKELQKFKKIANAIEAMEPEMQKLSDEELAAKTIEFREEIKIKYRKYLKRKELEQMATHLQFLKKQASEQQMLFFYSKQNKMHDENKTSGKSR